MSALLWIGTGLGALCGLLHGMYLLKEVGEATGSNLKGLYFAIWAFCLWTLFGSYVLAFLILGIVGQVIARLLPPLWSWRGENAS